MVLFLNRQTTKQNPSSTTITTKKNFEDKQQTNKHKDLLQSHQENIHLHSNHYWKREKGGIKVCGE